MKVIVQTQAVFNTKPTTHQGDRTIKFGQAFQEWTVSYSEGQKMSLVQGDQIPIGPAVYEVMGPTTCKGISSCIPIFRCKVVSGKLDEQLAEYVDGNGFIILSGDSLASFKSQHQRKILNNRPATMNTAYAF